MNDFPSTGYERGKIFAKTGVKVGMNYARHYLKKLQNKEASQSELHTETARQVFGEFTKLRGTALKLAQTLSIDQGFLPDEFAEVMTQAQYKVPPVNRSLVRSIIKRELGGYPEQLFKTFDPEAFAAASIGQVHRATLHDGTAVAVKVQYPGVRDTISSDVGLASALFKRFVSDKAAVDEYINEVRDTLMRETDYLVEGASIEQFHARFASDTIVTPRWIEERSTERVLCMTFIEGEHLGDFLERHPEQEERDLYGQLLWDFFHRQLATPEFIHADTHPGNFLLTPDGALGVIDYGCVKSFPKPFFDDYLRLLPTHLENDEEKILALYKRLDILKGDPSANKKEKEYFEFCKNYGLTFAMPYMEDAFDFGSAEYKTLLKGYTKNA
ncbi:MAG: ABC1 kinase family protein, partial [Balneolaceae bacterium]